MSADGIGDKIAQMNAGMTGAAQAGKLDDSLSGIPEPNQREGMPVDVEAQIQYGLATVNGEAMLFMGIPHAAWETMARGNGMHMDLSPAGIPIRLVIFSAADRATAIKFIAAAGQANGIEFEAPGGQP